MQVEPFNRSLRELQADVMINGRRRDHGAERAHLEVQLGALPQANSIGAFPEKHWICLHAASQSMPICQFATAHLVTQSAMQLS